MQDILAKSSKDVSIVSLRGLSEQYQAWSKKGQEQWGIRELEAAIGS